MSRANEKKKRKIIFISILCLVAVIAAAILIFYAKDIASAAGINTLKIERNDGQVQVTALDVGQSNCTVIFAGSDTILIDAGDYEAAPAIKAFLKANGIKEIDLLVITHPHVDHIGSVAELIDYCTIDKILLTPLSKSLIPTNYTYYNMLKKIDKCNVEVSTAVTGEEINLNKGSLCVLSGNGEYSDLNNCSMVLRYTYEETSFLFMADAEKPVEKNLMNSSFELKSDVLFVGHHGSRYASGADFLSRVSPNFAVISCGADNSYGFPHSESLDNLKACGAVLLRTDIDKTVALISDGKAVWRYNG